MKKVISLDNLPDSLKREVDDVQSAQDDKTLSMFIDNKDIRQPSDDGGFDLKSFSQTFNVYDLWGRFVRSGPKKVLLKDAPDNSVIVRRIKEKVEGIEYEGQIEITPAVIKGKNSDELIWPSDREEKIERALIRLASKGKIIRTSGRTGSQYAVVFSMNELSQELKSVNQTMSYAQIKEALEALQGSKLSFKYTETNTKNPEENQKFYESNMNFLSSLHFSGKVGQGGNVKCVAFLNAFMHNMIDSIEYKGYYFNRAQGFSRALSRWLMLRLYHLFRYAAEGKTHHFRLLSTMEKYGSISASDEISVNRLKALRRDMTTTMKDLKEGLAINDYECIGIKNDRGETVDYNYTIFPTDKFCQEIINLNKHNKAIQIKSGNREPDNITSK